MSWLSGYSYRKKVTISGSSGAGTDYQVKLSIGSSSGGDFHLEGHCEDFPNDIRFTGDDGTTLLDYWIEDPTQDPITVWVKVKDNLDNDVDIYVYYGKSGESSASDGESTFLFFDDFEKWEGWKNYRNGVVSQSNDTSLSGVYSLKKSNYNDPNGGYKLLPYYIGRDIVLEGWIYRPSSWSGGSIDRIGIEDENFNGKALIFSPQKDRFEKRAYEFERRNKKLIKRKRGYRFLQSPTLPERNA